jgi:7-cyano-7-deazaguanine synthase in queuosine biosynthesis
MSNKHHFKDSQSIDYCDFHENTGTLEIGFSSGSVYHYPDCPKEHYDALKQAASAGKHFHANIRRFKSIKVK